MGQKCELMLNETDKPFELPALVHQKGLFSKREHDLLSKYGRKAFDLESGRVQPDSDKQSAFVKVCQNKKYPESEFEHLWLRCRVAIEAEKEIQRLSGDLVRARSEAEHAKGEIDRLRKSHVDRIDRLVSESRSQQFLIDSLKEKLAACEQATRAEQPSSELSTTSPTRTARVVCTNCGGDGGATGQCYKCDGTGWVTGLSE